MRITRCRGHPNVQLTHRGTLEISCDSYLTVRGDCILCISAETLLKQCFSPDLDAGATIDVIILPPPWSSLKTKKVRIYCKKLCNIRGSVLRKSTHCDDRTLAILCSVAAADIKGIRDVLADPFSKALILVKPICRKH